MKGEMSVHNGFEIITTPAQPTLYIRTTTSVDKLPDAIGKALMAIAPYIGRMGGHHADAPFISYRSMEMPNLDVEIGFPIAAPLPGEGDITAGSIPAGSKAVGMHKGPYQNVAATYGAMAAWMREKGVEPTGLVYEHYYNSPMEVAESELLTKLVFLLR